MTQPPDNDFEVPGCLADYFNCWIIASMWLRRRSRWSPKAVFRHWPIETVDEFIERKSSVVISPERVEWRDKEMARYREETLKFSDRVSRIDKLVQEANQLKDRTAFTDLYNQIYFIIYGRTRI